MRAFILLPLLCCFFSTTLAAQIPDAALMNQVIQMKINREAPDEPLLADARGEFKALEDDEKIDYLQQSLRYVPEERYPKTAGTVFIRKEFGPALLLDAGGKGYALGGINYNAFDGRMEFKAGDTHVAFHPPYFPRVKMNKEDGTETTYVYGLLPDFPTHYSALVYKGEQYAAALHTRVETMDNAGFTAGKKHIATKSFFETKILYVYRDGVWSVVAPKPKALGKFLGWEKEVRAFIKENDLDPKAPRDLAAIVAFAEELY